MSIKSSFASFVYLSFISISLDDNNNTQKSGKNEMSILPPRNGGAMPTKSIKHFQNVKLIFNVFVNDFYRPIHFPVAFFHSLSFSLSALPFYMLV